MKVSELIEKLKGLPQDYDVFVQYRDEGGDYWGMDEDIRLDVDHKKVVL